MAKSGALPPPHVRAWYSYAFAAEVFSAVGIAIFLPIALEKMARDIGYLTPDLITPCLEVSDEDVGERVCKAKIFGGWVDTASFSMYVKSVAVLAQVVCIVSFGPLADSAYWRKRVLLIAAYSGSLACSTILLFPSTPYSFTPLLTAFLTIIGNAAYGTSIVCANAFLPGLAREDPDVQAAHKLAQRAGTQDDTEEEVELAHSRASLDDEARRLLPTAVPAVTMEAVTAISTSDLAAEAPLSPGPMAHYTSLLSLATSRISSVGTALGFFSGVSVLALLIVPVTLMGGTTSSLRVAVGVSAIWWAVFTIPAWKGLPAGDVADKLRLGGGRDGGGLAQDWKRVGQMIRPSEMRSLPNLFTFLLAWIFLSDGFHTTTYTAILYASSTLRMGPPKIILIGVLVQLAAVISSICAPRVQRRLDLSNQRLLLWIVLLAEIIPLYACIGLVLPFGGLRTEGEMYVAATWFGLLYGPFNSYSRAVYAELIPPGHESSFFSLFALTDKSASFVGPAVVGLIADHTGNIRNGFLFLLVMLAVPVPVLLRVRVKAGGEEAIGWSSTATAAGRRNTPS